MLNQRLAEEPCPPNLLTAKIIIVIAKIITTTTKIANIVVVLLKKSTKASVMLFTMFVVSFCSCDPLVKMLESLRETKLQLSQYLIQEHLSYLT